MRANTTRKYRGIALVYLLAAFTIIIFFVCLAVDYGRALVAKAELQSAADASARYALSGLSRGTEEAQNRAIDAANDNTADGTSVQVQMSDVEFGRWDKEAKSFTVLYGVARDSANAVRVSARRTAARGNPVNLSFASLIGRGSIDVQASAIASYVRQRALQQDVAATANPWLSGMPDGTNANLGNPANNPDKAPGNSPRSLNSVPLAAGTALSFDSIVGNANNGPGNKGLMFDPDGNVSDVVHNFRGAEHGKGDLYAPINSLVGVFLGPGRPDFSAPPATLDFSTAASRDFTTLSPQLKQPFFIGDGRNSRGDIQRFIVPSGATRLFLGIMDAYEWNNNAGDFTVTIYQDDSIGVVQ
jgi:Flp pilus assembly protein TadG